jgi:hypothetical protein
LATADDTYPVDKIGTWSDLTPVEQFVLLEGIEQALLSDIRRAWSFGRAREVGEVDGDQLPLLIRATSRLVELGLLRAWHVDRSEPEPDPAAVFADPRSWDGPFHLAGGERELAWNLRESASDVQRHALGCEHPDRRM